MAGHQAGALDVGARLEPLVQRIEDWQKEASKDAPATDAAWAKLAANQQFRQAVTDLEKQLPAGAAVPLGYEGKDLLEKADNAWARLNLLGLVGWVITGLAAMLGAKFWFNALEQALRMRAAGIKPDDTKPAT